MMLSLGRVPHVFGGLASQATASLLIKYFTKLNFKQYIEVAILQQA